VKTLKIVALAACFCALALLAGAAPSRAADPKDVLKGNIDQFIVILKDAKYDKGANKSEQDQKIWAILDQVFDFNAVARRALGRNWKRLSAAQQQEFVPLFKELLGTNYLHRIRAGYKDEKVVIGQADKDGDRKAVVHSNIVRASSKVPVDYSLYSTGQTWKVYDVKVEGVSLIKNYRTQFAEILVNGKPADLIGKVKKQLAELKAKIAAEK